MLRLAARIAPRIAASVAVPLQGSAQALSRPATMQNFTRIAVQNITKRTLAGGKDFFLDPADVTDRIMTVVKNFDKVDAEKVTPTSVFSDDLGLDSLDAVEVVMAIEDEFVIEIPDAEADKIASIEDAVKYIASHPQAK